MRLLQYHTLVSSMRLILQMLIATGDVGCDRLDYPIGLNTACLHLPTLLGHDFVCAYANL